jgi:hypothetical protein
LVSYLKLVIPACAGMTNAFQKHGFRMDTG